jgi:hypothetical protein
VPIVSNLDPFSIRNLAVGDVSSIVPVTADTSQVIMRSP